MTTVAVRERPILFSGAMVRAILEGRKTQTRRVIIPQPERMHPVGLHEPHWFMYVDSPDAKKRACWQDGESAYWTHCPFGAAGDRLWVRETHAILDMRPDIEEQERGTRPVGGCSVSVTYPADDYNQLLRCPEEAWRESFDADHVIYRPSIHMPRWASRLTLEITGIRVERVQEIGGRDVLAEGLGPVFPADPTVCYSELWDSLNAKRGFGWGVNPWVWAVEFRKVAS